MPLLSTFGAAASRSFGLGVGGADAPQIGLFMGSAKSVNEQNYNRVEFFDFASLGDATDFGDMALPHTPDTAGIGGETRAYSSY